MKIAYEHLLNFLEEKPSINDLSDKLFQLGHEHEIEDSIFDMEFTPNRGDCLSLLGISRDLNVFYKTNLDLPVYKKNVPLLDLNFINTAEDSCPQISFLNIEIKNQEFKYRNYLENYFTDLKLNKNNFFTDVSNYLAYEMGQPTHCYDFDEVGDDITLTKNKKNTKFTTLFENVIELKDSDLVFTSEEKIINLAGIMGNKDTACSNKTTNALVECAYFIPEAIIGRAIKYNLHSDAAHQFERGTDPKCHENVLRRFIEIVSDHTEITKLELYSNNNYDFNEQELQINIDKVNRILGLDISKIDYINSLSSLGFEVDQVIKVPSFRSDINHQNDLAEEIARVIGYDNIPIKSINLKQKENNIEFFIEDKIRSFLIHNGFAEVINSPFCSVSNSVSIKVDNPLDSNRMFLRTNIIDSLLENLIYNENRQKNSIKFFEISSIYTSDKSIKKQNKIAIIISGRMGQNYKEFSKKLDHKYLSDIFKEININIDNDIKIIDRKTINSKLKNPIFTIELELNSLAQSFSEYSYKYETPVNFIKYKPISEFPSSFRDLSFSIKDPTKIGDVINTLSNIKSEILKNLFMFDFYENKKVNEIKIGYRFVFQSYNRTLTDIEIDNIIEEIVDSVLLIESVSLPGNI